MRVWVVYHIPPCNGKTLSAQEILVRTVIVWEVHVCVLQVSSEQSIYTRLCYPELCISASVATDLQYFKISTSELYITFLFCYIYFISLCLGLQSSAELLVCFIYLHLKLIHMYILRCRNKIDSFEMYRTWYRLKVVLLILSQTGVVVFRYFAGFYQWTCKRWIWIRQWDSGQCERCQHLS